MFTKHLIELCDADLQSIPLEFLIQHARAVDLLNVWNKLPETYKTSDELQKCLPCFKHYNTPESRTHIDGPPSSIKKCLACNIGGGKN
jgi:hypothetical protein